MNESLYSVALGLEDKFREECGVFGVYAAKPIDTFSLIQFGLFALQHRGQEACGFSVLKEGKINSYKSKHLVLDAFQRIIDPEPYQGKAVIGHTRYSTAGGQSKKNIQPLFLENEQGQGTLSVAHNGNLVNAVRLRKRLEAEGVSFVSDHSDTEVILRLIQKHLHLGLEQAIKETVKHIKGAYSVVVLRNDEMAIFRDPHGIRPLCYGIIDVNTHVFSSETCGLDAVGAQYVRDVLPSELIIVDKEGLRSSIMTDKTRMRICSFEYIYFSRPDSRIENIDVYKIREQSGYRLYEQHPVKADVVVGVPDSGVPAAIGYAKASGIPFKPILIKNKYIGRSFIVPTQEMRERIVNLKLNPIVSEVKDRCIVIIDDSIVRGTTSKRLVDLFKKAGAKEIHFRSASPPIIAPCFLGVDTPDKKALISTQMSKQELAKNLGVKSLEFLSIENLKDLLGSSNYCFGCFTEKYPVTPEAEDIPVHVKIKTS